MASEIYALPEDCITNALSLTSPKDACRLSLVASIFRSAAQSDAVWERFLPDDYRHLIGRSSDGSDSLLARLGSKKELYLYLCDHPILIDSGLKSFSLEKWSGKKCYMLSARDLFIVWGDTDQYWQWTSHPESRFSEVAELRGVCWFEIRGKINMKMLSSGTNYAAYLVFTCKSRMYGFEHNAVETYVGIGGHDAEKHTVCLDPDGSKRQRYETARIRTGWFYPPFAHVQRLRRDDGDGDGDDDDLLSVERPNHYPKERDDGWMEVELGELFVKGGEDGDLEMAVMEVKGGNWKSGLIIQGIEIRPKECL